MGNVINSISITSSHYVQTDVAQWAATSHFHRFRTVKARRSAFDINTRFSLILLIWPRHLILLLSKVFWQFLRRVTVAVQGDNRQSLHQSEQCSYSQQPTTGSSCLVSTARHDSQLQRLHTHK